MAQVVQHLPSKHEALSSNFSITKIKKKKKMNKTNQRAERQGHHTLLKPGYQRGKVTIPF
jgi:hypothetical protein